MVEIIQTDNIQGIGPWTKCTRLYSIGRYFGDDNLQQYWAYTIRDIDGKITGIRWVWYEYLKDRFHRIKLEEKCLRPGATVRSMEVIDL